VTSLSGGNQQKVAIAAALAAQPALLVLEEPTRGVDVGAKREIYRMIRGFAAGGGGVVTVCTEVTEVFELCDRVVVVDQGRVQADLEVQAFPNVAQLAEHLATLTEGGD
jgi:ribose transport system ATP-binding protein